jgi:S-DNA-T family DNA segregation ATPase FtsK/SpoIIIE
VILDQGGAETLLGQGDMLFRPAGTSKLQRIQGAFVTEDEIAKITTHWANQGEPEFAEELLEAPEGSPDAAAGDDDFDPDSDDLLEQAAHLVVESGTASVSMVQRRLRVGYTRAGRLIDMLERRGIISGYEGSKPRQVLVSLADLPRVLGGSTPAGPSAEPAADEDAPEADPVDEDTGPLEAVGAPDD